MSKILNNHIYISQLALRIESEKLTEIANAQIAKYVSTKGPVQVNFKNKKATIQIKPHANLSWNENGISGNVPISLLAKIDIPLKDISVKGELDVYFHTQIVWNDDNTLQTQTTLEKVNWEAGPDIYPALVDFVIPDQKVVNIVDDALPEIAKHIDANLRKVLDLNRMVAFTIWERLLSIPLRSGHQIHLLMTPEYVEIYKPIFQNGSIHCAINCKINIAPALDDTKIDVKYVPKITYLNESPQTLHTTVKTSLSLSTLDEPALKLIHAIGSIEKAIGCSIEKVMIRGVNNDGLAIALRLKGALNGGLSIAGRPVINVQTLTCDIDDLTFNFSGKNVLSSLKGNIALSLAKSTIRKQFPLQLKPYVDSLVNQLNNMISELRLANNIVLKGYTENWTIDDVDILADNLSVAISSKLILKIV